MQPDSIQPDSKQRDSIPRESSEPESRQQTHARILEAIRAIPIGCTASYGGIARAAGLPGRARLVGWLLRHSEVELPWHRIVRADGRSAFAVNSKEWRQQRKLLAAEGLKPGYLGAYALAAEAATDMDALLWRPAIAGGPADGPTSRKARPRARLLAQATQQTRKCHH